MLHANKSQTNTNKSPMLKFPAVSTRFRVLLFLLCVSCTPVGVAQSQNPLADDPRAAAAGGTLFRAQCATCHGADAKGIETIDAPDLTLLWQREGISDAAVFAIIRNGRPGTIMPPHSFTDPQLWMLVSYLHSVDASRTTRLPPGDREAGGRLFAAQCAECHRAGGVQGGSLGPDLGRLASRRSLDSLRTSLRDPDALINRGYEAVTLVTADNERVRGLIKSEDAFTLQILDSEQQLRAFAKRDLRELSRDQQSLMPAFSEAELSEQQFIDIVHYLQSP